MLVLTLFPLNAQTAFATDPVKGVEVHTDSSKLEASVAAAKAAGVDVQKEDDDLFARDWSGHQTVQSKANEKSVKLC